MFPQEAFKRLLKTRIDFGRLMPCLGILLQTDKPSLAISAMKFLEGAFHRTPR